MMEAAGVNGHSAADHNTSWRKQATFSQKKDIVCHLRGPRWSVGECSLHSAFKLCDACLRDVCLEETLAAFLCECQLLLRCTSQRSLCD